MPSHRLLECTSVDQGCRDKRQMNKYTTNQVGGRGVSETSKSSRHYSFRIEEAESFRMIYVENVFGSLDPGGGRMIFYVDRRKPRIVDEPVGALETDEIVHELQVELRMSPASFKSIAEWMAQHVEGAEKQFGPIVLPGRKVLP